MKKLRILTMLLCLSLLLSIVGCGKKESVSGMGQEGKEENQIQISFTFDTFVLERWTRERDIFVDTAQKLGARVDVQTANGDVGIQKEQIRKFIEANTDVIVIVAADCYALSEEVQEARNKGIKVISYDRMLQNVETDLYITVDSEEVGREMAKNIQDNLPGGGRIVMICGPETDSNSLDVNRGFEEEIKGGSWDIIYKDYVKSWAPENGTQAIADAFQQTDGKIDAFMCGNDGLAGYVIRALSEQQLAGKVVVVGQDADLEACQRVVEGTQSMTVYKPIHELAKKAAEMAVKMAKNEKLSVTETKKNEIGLQIPYYGLKPTAVTAQNIDHIIINSGFHAREEVYLNVKE